MTTLHIPKPCHENWDAMTPQQRGRHCAVCDKTVVDLTRMAPAEGRRFLGRLRDDLAAGAHVCVRAHADAAGRLLAPSVTRRLLTNGLAAVLAVAMAGCNGNGPAVSQAQPAPTHQTPIQRPAQTPQPTPMMGEPVAKGPPACIQGDVAVAPRTQPPEMGQVVAQPQPEPLMGKPSAQPVAQPAIQLRTIKGEIAADPRPAPRETTGKVEVHER